MIDMQCSWFPDLWMKDCCIAHDLGASDYEFLTCVSQASMEPLGIFGGVFALIIVAGMICGRPIRNLWLKLTRK